MIKGDRVGKFWFSPTLPEEVKNSVKDILINNEYIIPNWCNEVRVYWDAEGDNADGNLVSAYIETNYAYRFASLSICPPFLSEDVEDRDVRLKHELCHIVSAPLVYYVRDIVGALEKDETMSFIVGRESSEKVESMTEDLALIILKAEEVLKKRK